MNFNLKIECEYCFFILLGISKHEINESYNNYKFHLKKCLIFFQGGYAMLNKLLYLFYIPEYSRCR